MLCRDRPKFGGKGTKRQCCIHRKCIAVSFKEKEIHQRLASESQASTLCDLPQIPDVNTDVDPASSTEQKSSTNDSNEVEKGLKVTENIQSQSSKTIVALTESMECEVDGDQLHISHNSTKFVETSENSSLFDALKTTPPSTPEKGQDDFKNFRFEALSDDQTRKQLMSPTANAAILTGNSFGDETTPGNSKELNDFCIESAKDCAAKSQASQQTLQETDLSKTEGCDEVEKESLCSPNSETLLQKSVMSSILDSALNVTEKNHEKMQGHQQNSKKKITSNLDDALQSTFQMSLPVIQSEIAADVKITDLNVGEIILQQSLGESKSDIVNSAKQLSNKKDLEIDADECVINRQEMSLIAVNSTDSSNETQQIPPEIIEKLNESVNCNTKVLSEEDQQLSEEAVTAADTANNKAKLLETDCEYSEVGTSEISRVKQTPVIEKQHSAESLHGYKQYQQKSSKLPQDIAEGSSTTHPTDVETQLLTLSPGKGKNLHEHDVTGKHTQSHLSFSGHLHDECLLSESPANGELEATNQDRESVGQEKDDINSSPGLFDNLNKMFSTIFEASPSSSKKVLKANLVSTNSVQHCSNSSSAITKRFADFSDSIAVTSATPPTVTSSAMQKQVISVALPSEKAKELESSQKALASRDFLLNTHANATIVTSTVGASLSVDLVPVTNHLNLAVSSKTNDNIMSVHDLLKAKSHSDKTNPETLICTTAKIASQMQSRMQVLTKKTTKVTSCHRIASSQTSSFANISKTLTVKPMSSKRITNLLENNNQIGNSLYTSSQKLDCTETFQFPYHAMPKPKSLAQAVIMSESVASAQSISAELGVSTEGKALKKALSFTQAQSTSVTFSSSINALQSTSLVTTPMLSGSLSVAEVVCSGEPAAQLSKALGTITQVPEFSYQLPSNQAGTSSVHLASQLPRVKNSTDRLVSASMQTTQNRPVLTTMQIYGSVQTTSKMTTNAPVPLQCLVTKAVKPVCVNRTKSSNPPKTNLVPFVVPSISSIKLLPKNGNKRVKNTNTSNLTGLKSSITTVSSTAVPKTSCMSVCSSSAIQQHRDTQNNCPNTLTPISNLIPVSEGSGISLQDLKESSLSNNKETVASTLAAKRRKFEAVETRLSEFLECEDFAAPRMSTSGDGLQTMKFKSPKKVSRKSAKRATPLVSRSSNTSVGKSTFTATSKLNEFVMISSASSQTIYSPTAAVTSNLHVPLNSDSMTTPFSSRVLQSRSTFANTPVTQTLVKDDKSCGNRVLKTSVAVVKSKKILHSDKTSPTTPVLKPFVNPAKVESISPSIPFLNFNILPPSHHSIPADPTKYSELKRISLDQCLSLPNKVIRKSTSGRYRRPHAPDKSTTDSEKSSLSGSVGHATTSQV